MSRLITADGGASRSQEHLETQRALMSGLAEEPKKQTQDSERKTMFNGNQCEGGDGMGQNSSGGGVVRRQAGWSKRTDKSGPFISHRLND